jgi:UDP-N-acetylglucosamine 3-dehydrogenase
VLPVSESGGMPTDSASSKPMMKAAVIGAGTMGSSHSRVYAEMDDVDLVGVADPDTGACGRISRIYGPRIYADYRELLDREQPDLVSVAVPSGLHGSVACEVMSRGVHVLVEKPLALTIEEGLEIIAAAERYGVKLSVGHIERFNPAIVELKRRLEKEELGRVFQVRARRVSPFPGRIQDVGVILDLATHDIDVIRVLLGSEVDRVYAEVERKVHTSREDLLSALFRFRNGVIGVLDVNWLTPSKVRQLAVLGEGGMYVTDYLTQEVYWYRNTPMSDSWESLSVFRGASEGDMVKIHFPKKEPLRAELESFVAAVRDDREPEVSGRDALAAIDLSLTLAESGRLHVPVTPRLGREGAD